jgi:hypothetical protein
VKYRLHHIHHMVSHKAALFNGPKGHEQRVSVHLRSNPDVYGDVAIKLKCSAATRERIIDAAHAAIAYEALTGSVEGFPEQEFDL